MKLRVGWSVLCTSVAVASIGRFLPLGPGLAVEGLATAMAFGVVVVDVRALRRSKAKGGGPAGDWVPQICTRLNHACCTPDAGPCNGYPRTTSYTYPDSDTAAEYCNGGTCYYLEPHRHGFACDKTCTTCGGH